MLPLAMVWDQVKEKIKNEIDDVVYNTFFSDTELMQLTDSEALVVTNLQFNCIVLNEKENITLMNNCLADVTHKAIKTRVMLTSDYKKTMAISEEKASPVVREDHLIPDYTFDNFVVGPSNKESYSAALAVAMNPGQNSYNPLFIYGDSGLGKTHLLNAIGNYVKKRSPEKRILYISCYDFINEVGLAFRDNRINEYKTELNNLDLLMVDDVQYLSGKEKTGEFFFSIYNDLFNNRKQIVFTCDRPPGQIKALEARLVSRFQRGLSVTITSPEYETAYKILQMKLKHNNIPESSIDPEVLSYLATNFSSDVRKLEGSLNRLLFYAINLSETDTIGLDLCAEAFRDSFTPSEKDKMDISDVIAGVANYYGLTRQQLVSKTRIKNIATARHIAMYLCRKNIDASYLKIGEEFGGRDHSTVLAACEKIDKLVKTDESYRRAVKEIEHSLFK